MKTKTLISALIIGAFLLCSCGGVNRKQQAGDLPVINLTRSHPRKELRLQDIATIEYVALETTDDVLLGQHSMLSYVSDNYIVVFEFMLGDIFVFNRNGKIISRFNHRGQGPMEYVRISGAGVIFDENAGEIFVFDVSTHRILVYSISGEYKRTLRIPPDLFIGAERAHSFDDETILVYDGVRLTNSGTAYNEKPYLLLSKKDGSIVYSFDIRLPVRYINRTAIGVGTGSDRAYFPLSISTPNNRHFGQNFVIADISSDTIFLFTQNRVLTPLLVSTPSVHSSEPRRVLTSLLKTDTFILLQKTTLDFAATQRGNNRTLSLVLMYETAYAQSASCKKSSIFAG